MLNNYSTANYMTQCHGCDREDERKWYVFHNPKLGLLSLSSNGFNWITIADKNLGASEVRYPGDTNTKENVGLVHQWGNCYGFEPLKQIPIETITANKADASGYGPNNPRYNDTFIRNLPNLSNYRDSSDNLNIRGGGGDEEYYMFDNGNDRKLRQFMCDDGFHIPSGGELIKLLQELVRIDNILNDRGTEMVRLDDYSATVNNIIYKLDQNVDLGKYILAPNAGGNSPQDGRYMAGGVTFMSSSSSPKIYNGHHNDCLRLWVTGSVQGIYTFQKTSGGYIRPFKNEPVTPDENWIKLY